MSSFCASSESCWCVVMQRRLGIFGCVGCGRFSISCRTRRPRQQCYGATWPTYAPAPLLRHDSPSLSFQAVWNAAAAPEIYSPGIPADKELHIHTLSSCLSVLTYAWRICTPRVQLRTPVFFDCDHVTCIYASCTYFFMKTQHCHSIVEVTARAPTSISHGLPVLVVPRMSVAHRAGAVETWRKFRV